MSTINTTNGQQSLSPADKMELDFLKHHIKYNNDWDGSEPWRCGLQDEFDQSLKAKGIKSIFVPVKLRDNAFDVLRKQPVIAKLFSTVLDINEQLPYNPDVAFDSIWRTYEILLSLYQKEVLATENTDKVPATELIKRICPVVKDVLSINPDLAQAYKQIFANYSLSALRFCFNFLPDSSRVPQHFNLLIKQKKNNVGGRMREVLNIGPKDGSSTTVYDEFVKKYLADDYYNCVNAGNQNETRIITNKAVKCLRLIMGGEDFELNGVSFNGLSLEKILEFSQSVILYSIRNNRFHGDNYSPFKSSRSGKDTYYSFYHNLISTYSLFWIVLYDFLDKKSIEKFFGLDDIASCVNESLERLKCLPNK